MADPLQDLSKSMIHHLTGFYMRLRFFLGLGFRVKGLGFRVKVFLGFRVKGFGFRVKAFGFRVNQVQRDLMLPPPFSIIGRFFFVFVHSRQGSTLDRDMLHGAELPESQQLQAWK